MGNNASKQADVRHLVEQGLPFETEEMESLVSAYYRVAQQLKQQQLQQQQSTTVQSETANPSHDIGSLCFQWSSGETSTPEHIRWMKTVERDILPPDFGSRFATLVSLPTGTALTTTGNTTNDTETTTTTCRQRQALERYVETLANACGRRGNPAALGTLFQLGVPEESARFLNSKDLVDTQGREIKASVVYVLDLAWRMAMAIQLLPLQPSQASPMILLECTLTTKAPTRIIQSMALSCIDFVRQVRMRRSVELSPGSEALDDADLQQGRCSKMDFIEWVEHSVPVLVTVLPALVQSLVLPHNVPPLTLHMFDFPALAQPSLFVEVGNEDEDSEHHQYVLNSILFSFGCMNKALGGQVSPCDVGFAQLSVPIQRQ